MFKVGRCKLKTPLHLHNIAQVNSFWNVNDVLCRGLPGTDKLRSILRLTTLIDRDCWVFNEWRLYSDLFQPAFLCINVADVIKSLKYVLNTYFKSVRQKLM